MQRESHVGMAEFREALTPEAVRSTRIIQGAIGAGVLFFALGVFLLHTLNPPASAPPTPASILLVRILTVAHLVMAAAIYPLAHRIFTRTVSRERLASSAGTGPAGALSLMRTGIITRLAMYEGVAFLGLIVCTVGVLQGVLGMHPVYWINAFSAVILLLFVVRTFPTKERLLAIFEERFLR